MTVCGRARENYGEISRIFWALLSLVPGMRLFLVLVQDGRVHIPKAQVGRVPKAQVNDMDSVSSTE